MVADPGAVASATPWRFRAPEQLAPYEDGWRELAAATPGGSYFTTPDWVLAVWETSAVADAEAAVWIDGDGRVEAVLALARMRARLHPRVPIPVTHWGLLGYGDDAADHGVVLTVPHRRADVGAWARGRCRRGTVWMPAVDPDADPVPFPRGVRPVARTVCPRLAVAPDRAVGSAGFRRLMARRGRQLTGEGVNFRWVGPGEVTRADLETVLRLHRVRRDHLGTATGFTPRRLELHARLLDRADSTRGPAVMFAEADGVAVGAVYGFRWQDTFAYYNGGWDPAYARLSLGTVLLDRTIATTVAAGVRTFDFLRGSEAYKFASFGAEQRWDTQWLRPKGPVARTAGVALRLGKALGARSSGGPAGRR
ncbi:GNAT family N-acetyltransferase [Yinghuangia seranimata]|uniref:GNAT family N-acetyltransferase n=1 Tax=Yinghuangia seranimata TaxID=408067 RepID=UPI00248D1B75|nr:GNAT family N-acetyltransferase [Yinghuangia seranimata]MDI2128396.1 GNAT family N-acetyltransferase [Yinghuangia seranimata]